MNQFWQENLPPIYNIALNNAAKMSCRVFYATYKIRKVAALIIWVNLGMYLHVPAEILSKKKLLR